MNDAQHRQYRVAMLNSLATEIRVALDEADSKHGDNSISCLSVDSPRWLSILVEEVGEIANTLTYDFNSERHTSDTRSELLDVIAVCASWIDAIDQAKEQELASESNA